MGAFSGSQVTLVDRTDSNVRAGQFTAVAALVLLDSSHEPPPTDSLIVCLDDHSYRKAEALYGGAGATRKLVRSTERIVGSFNTVWFVDYGAVPTTVTAEVRRALTNACSHATASFVYGHCGSSGRVNSFIVNVLTAYGDRCDDMFNYAAPVFSVRLKRSPERELSSLLHGKQSLVVSIPCGAWSPGAVPVDDRYDRLPVALTSTRVGGELMYRSLVIFGVSVLVLLPVGFRIHRGGAVVGFPDRSSCAVVAAGAVLELVVSAPSPSCGYVLSALSLSEGIERFWNGSRFWFDTKSCEARMACDGLYVQSEFDCLERKSVGVIELSEPFDQSKPENRYRVITNERKFRVGLPRCVIACRCVVSGFRMESGSGVLKLGPVRLFDHEAQVSVDGDALDACFVETAERKAKVSFNITFVADEYSYDDGGPSGDEGFPSYY